MKKIFCISAFVLECLFSWGQCLTSDYAAFEHLMNDVNSIVDSCLSDSTVDYSADYSIKVWIDSCGFIRKTEVKKIGGGGHPPKNRISALTLSRLYLTLIGNMIFILKIIIF